MDLEEAYDLLEIEPGCGTDKVVEVYQSRVDIYGTSEDLEYAKELVYSYEFLELREGCGTAELTKRYKRLAAIYHPDKNPNSVEEAAALFKQLQCSRTTVEKNEIKPKNPNKVRRKKRKRQIFAIPNRQRKAIETRQDDIELTLLQLYEGVTIAREVSGEEYCKECSGYGANYVHCTKCSGRGYHVRTLRRLDGIETLREPCPFCKQTGEVDTSKCSTCHGHRTHIIQVKLEITIDPGTMDGETFLCKTGDGFLRLVIRQLPNDLFRRVGNELWHKPIDINYEQAVSNHRMLLHHLNGKMYKIQCDGVITPGSVFIVPGLGMPIREMDRQYGPMCFEFNIIFPPEALGVLDDGVIYAKKRS